MAQAAQEPTKPWSPGGRSQRERSTRRGRPGRSGYVRKAEMKREVGAAAALVDRIAELIDYVQQGKCALDFLLLGRFRCAIALDVFGIARHAQSNIGFLVVPLHPMQSLDSLPRAAAITISSCMSLPRHLVVLHMRLSRWPSHLVLLPSSHTCRRVAARCCLHTDGCGAGYSRLLTQLSSYIQSLREPLVRPAQTCRLPRCHCSCPAHPPGR